MFNSSTAEECDIPWPTTYLMPDLKKDLDKEGFLKFEGTITAYCF